MKTPKNHSKYQVMFGIIVFCAFGLRLLLPSSASLSTQEIATLSSALQPIQFEYATAQITPLYSLFLRGWIELFGDSDRAVRSLAALFSFCTIFPLFGIARILFNKRIAFTTIFLFAVSPIALTTVMVSPLSLLVLFSMMSTWALLMMIRRKNLEHRIFYGVTVVGAIYTHPAFWFLLIFHQLIAVTAFSHNEARHLTLKQWGILQLVFATGIALTLPEAIPAIQTPFERGFATPVIALATYLFEQCGSIGLSVVSIGILYQLFFNSRRYQIIYRSFLPKVIQIVIWIAVVGIPPFMFNFAHGEWGRSNSAILMLPPFLMLIACGIDTFEQKRRRQTIIAVLVALSLNTIGTHWQQPTTAEWSHITATEQSHIVDSSLYTQFQRYSSLRQQRSSILFDTTEQSRVKIREITDTSMSITVITHPRDSLTVRAVSTILGDDFTIAHDTTYTARNQFNRKSPTVRTTHLQRL